MKRSNFLAALTLAKKHLNELLDKLVREKVFRVQAEDAKQYYVKLNTINALLKEISGKLGSIKVETPKTELTPQVPSDEKISDLSHNMSLYAESAQAGNVATHTLLEEVKRALTNLEINVSKVKLNIPETQKVKGDVSVTNFPKEYDFEKIVRELQNLQQAVGSIKIESPQPIKIPEFPKNVSMAESKALLKSLQELSEKLEELPTKIKIPQVDFPSTISVDNFPPQRIPTPVTHVSINGLRGEIQATAVTVGTNQTELPVDALSNRRSILIYNNSAVTVFIGGAAVTTASGLPIVASTYSPVIDASSNMLLFGIVASGTANVRVIELSDEAYSGK